MNNATLCYVALQKYNFLFPLSSNSRNSALFIRPYAKRIR